MHVLLNGGCRFSDSPLVRRLVAGRGDMVVADRLTDSGNPAELEGVEHLLTEGEISAAEVVAEPTRGRAVVDLAAETHAGRLIVPADEAVRTDVAGTHGLLESARAAGARLVEVSMDELCGDVPPGATSENDPLRSASPHASSGPA